MLKILRENVESICFLDNLATSNFESLWYEIENNCCVRLRELLGGIDSLEEAHKKNGKWYYENKLADAE